MALLEMELNQWLLSIIMITISYSLYLLFAIVKPRKKLRLPLPPGPRAMPLVGNLLLLGNQPHRSLASLAKIHGPVMTLKLGLNTTVIVSSPAAAKEALQKKDQFLADRWIPDAAQILDHPGCSIIWLPYNHMYKYLRTICITNLFTHKRLEASKHLRHQKMQELNAYFQSHAGRPVNVGRAMYGTVLNLISNTMFSSDVVDVGSEDSQKFRDLVTELTKEAGKANVSDFFPVLQQFDLQGRRRCMTVLLRKFYEFIDGVIDNRVNCKSAGTAERADDFLDYLLELHSESKLNRQTLRTLLLDLIAAGTDSTSITLEWAMAELIRNPNIISKVRAELEEVVGSSKPKVEESDTAKLVYLNAVVKEVTRYHPSGPLLAPHMANQDTELGGYFIPKGNKVLVNIWAIGRDEEAWSEPEVFRPERFLDSQVDFKGQDFQLLPFGSGRRSCPGLPLATRMLHLTLASLVQAFEWKLPDGLEPKDMELKEKFGTTLSVVAPVIAVPLPIYCK